MILSNSHTHKFMQEIKTRLGAILSTLEDVLSNHPSPTRLEAISDLFKGLTDMNLDDFGDLSTQVLCLNGTTYWDFDFVGDDFKIMIQVRTGVDESYQILHDLED